MRLVDDGRAFDAISDAVDECAPGSVASPLSSSLTHRHAVNKLKGQNKKWDDKSEFDAEKDKNSFRQYEEACDRVKNFYREQHGRHAPRSLRFVDPDALLRS